MLWQLGLIAEVPNLDPGDSFLTVIGPKFSFLSMVK